MARKATKGKKPTKEESISSESESISEEVENSSSTISESGSEINEEERKMLENVANEEPSDSQSEETTKADSSPANSEEESGEETGSGSEEKANTGDDEEEKLSRTIFIKGLDYDVREKDLKAEMEKLGDVVRVNIPMAYNDKRNKGFAYVEFAKIEAKEKAIKLNNQLLLGREVIIDNAKARSNFKIYTVFVQNIAFDVKKEDIKEYFSKFGPVYNVTLPIDQEHEGRNKGFAFVEYKDEEIVKKIISNKKDQKLNGRPLYVSYGNKTEERNERRSKDRLYGRRDSNSKGSRFEGSGRSRDNNRDFNNKRSKSNRKTFNDED